MRLEPVTQLQVQMTMMTLRRPLLERSTSACDEQNISSQFFSSCCKPVSVISSSGRFSFSYFPFLDSELFRFYFHVTFRRNS